MHGSNKLPVIPEKEEFPIALSADKAENTPRNPPFMTDRCPHPNENFSFPFIKALLNVYAATLKVLAFLLQSLTTLTTLHTPHTTTA